jgi:TctA family transporter
MDSFWGSFVQILSWPTVGFLVGGTLIGLVLGVIPGLGGITILALLLPLTYTLDFQYAIVLMTAIMAVTITSDTIPTILIGVPPTAGASATLLDGHAMALNGEASRALGASYTSSIIGGVLGAICLWLSIPILRPFVLAFGPPEIFVVALWGLTMLGALSSGNMCKGLAAGFLGILLGTIGRSPTSGIYRYSFDIPYLIDGLKVVTVSLGLFAIPEVIKMATTKGSIPGGKITGDLLRGQLQGMADVIRHWALLIRGSLIGVWIGIVPGVGSVTADWFAYAHAVQSAKDKSRFGKGDVRGIIAPEASNNSCKGGDFIPTLAFGVPGSASMSLVLGAFLIAGVHPGPNMLTTDIGITYKIIWALALANIVGGGVCLLATAQIAKLIYLPKHYLIAVITTFLVLAVYIGTKDSGDILVMILFGALGFVMKQYGWARPPLIVGFVLSDIAEWNFVLSVTLMGISWLWRPMVMGMILIFVANQAWTYLKERQMAKDEAVSRVAPKPVEGDEDED